MNLRLLGCALLAVCCFPAGAAAAARDCPMPKTAVAYSAAARLIEKATALTRERKDAEAAALYQAYIDKHPRDAVILTAYAGQLLILRDGAGAQALYERALALAERKPAVDAGQLKIGLAGALYMQRKHAQVVALLEPLSNDPCAYLNETAWSAYAGSLFFSGRVDDAARVADASIARGSRDLLTLMVGIEAHAALKQSEAAARTAILAAQEAVLTPQSRESLAESVRELALQEAALPLLSEAQAGGLFDAAWLPAKPGPESVEELVPLYAYQPYYPSAAAHRGIEGWVDVLIVVGPQGEVLSASVVKAEPESVFDGAALEAARKSRFRPVLIDGQAESAQGVRRYNFYLKADSRDEG